MPGGGRLGGLVQMLGGGGMMMGLGLGAAGIGAAGALISHGLSYQNNLRGIDPGITEGLNSYRRATENFGEALAQATMPVRNFGTALLEGANRLLGVGNGASLQEQRRAQLTAMQKSIAGQEDYLGFARGRLQFRERAQGLFERANAFAENASMGIAGMGAGDRRRLLRAQQALSAGGEEGYSAFTRLQRTERGRALFGNQLIQSEIESRDYAKRFAREQGFGGAIQKAAERSIRTELNVLVKAEFGNDMKSAQLVIDNAVSKLQGAVKELEAKLKAEKERLRATQRAMSEEG